MATMQRGRRTTGRCGLRLGPTLALASLVAALVAGPVVVGCADESPTHDPAAALAPRWHAFAYCYAGESPASSEALHQLLTEITIGLEPRVLPAGTDNDWPRRCSQHAEALLGAIGQLGPDDGNRFESMSKWLVDIVSALQQGKLPERSDLSALWSSANRKFPPPWPAVSGVVAAPKPAQVFRPDDLSPLGPRSTGIAAATRTDDGTLQIIFHGHEAVCSFPPAASRVGCTYYPDALPPMRYWPEIAGAEVGAELLLSVRGKGLYSLRTGQQLIGSAETDLLGRAMKSGAAVAIGRPAYRHNKPRGPYRLHVRQPDGTVTTDAIERPTGDTRLRVIRDHLMWVEGEPSDHERLLARQILNEPPGLGPVVELGPAAYPARPWSCYTEQAAFHYRPDRRASSEAGPGTLAIWQGGSWQPLVEVPARPSVPPASSGAMARACQGEQLTILEWRTDALHTAFTRLRCGTAGCRSTRAEMKHHGVEKLERGLGDDAEVLVALLGEQVAVVWRARGVVRMKLAPLEQLDQASERVLLHEDHLAGGHLLHSAQLYGSSHGTAALLLVDTDMGLFPLRIDASGEVKVPSIQDELALAR